MKFPGKVIAHGIMGGVRSRLSGGNFNSGFLSGAFGKLATPIYDDIYYKTDSYFAVSIASVVVGGTSSVIGGGKFANGGITAAFGAMFNWSTTAHREFIRGAYGKQLSQEQLRLIENGSKFADSRVFQDDDHAYMHSMSSDSLSVEGSNDLTDAYMIKNMRLFYALRESNPESAYFHLGMALHPVMDSTSPVHTGTQKWSFIDFWKHGPLPSTREGILTAVQQPYWGNTINKMRAIYPGH